MSTIEIWDKQWKICRGWLEKFALGRFPGKSDSGKSYYPKEPPVGKFPDNPIIIIQTLGLNKINEQGKSGFPAGKSAGVKSRHQAFEIQYLEYLYIYKHIYYIYILIFSIKKYPYW